MLGIGLNTDSHRRPFRRRQGEHSVPSRQGRPREAWIWLVRSLGIGRSTWV